MQFTISNGELLNYDREIKEAAEGTPHVKPSVFAILLRKEIRNFYSVVAPRLKYLNDLTTKMTADYFVIENNIIQMEEPSKILDASGKPSDAAPVPKMKPGKLIEDFQKEMAELLSKTVDLTF